MWRIKMDKCHESILKFIIKFKAVIQNGTVLHIKEGIKLEIITNVKSK